MPRKIRIKNPGFYHIINRGVARRSIFLEDADYEMFLMLLKDMIKSYDIVLHTYCLMPNHYHILLETKQDNISDAIKDLNSYYAVYFNKKYKRSGHLWQGRFSSYFLYDDAHFWIVAKYIERNPITALMVTDISKYKYQSFSLWKQHVDHNDILENSKIKDMTIKEYEEYISTDLHVDALDTVYVSPKVVTKDGESKVLLKRLETFFELDRDINRDINIKKSYEYGYKKSEIAKFLDLNVSTITRKIKKKGV